MSIISVTSINDDASNIPCKKWECDMKVTVSKDLVGGGCGLSEIIPWHLLKRLNKKRESISAKISNNTPEFLNYISPENKSKALPLHNPM